MYNPQLLGYYLNGMFDIMPNDVGRQRGYRNTKVLI